MIVAVWLIPGKKDKVNRDNNLEMVKERKNMYIAKYKATFKIISIKYFQ